MISRALLFVVHLLLAISFINMMSFPLLCRRHTALPVQKKLLLLSHPPPSVFASKKSDPSFPGTFINHGSLIWHQIPLAKTKPLTVSQFLLTSGTTFGLIHTSVIDHKSRLFGLPIQSIPKFQLVQNSASCINIVRHIKSIIQQLNWVLVEYCIDFYSSHLKQSTTFL